MAEFARLGITGLSNRDTVAFYREQWADAMKKRKAKVVRLAILPHPVLEKHDVGATRVVSAGSQDSSLGSAYAPVVADFVETFVADNRQPNLTHLSP